MINEKPTVSVIIPTYNRAYLIGRSIRSVLDQTYRDFEIIIVDDGSSDNTEEVIRNLSDTRIKYVRLQENKGSNAARNRGIKLAKGEYIAFQDSDDEWLPEKLEKQIEMFKDAPDELGVVYTGIYRIENNIKKYIPSGNITKKEGDIHKSLLKDNFVTIHAMVKKECFKKVGMFDEIIPRLQDWELWIRISKYYNFEYIDEPLALSYYQSVSISVNQDALIIALKLVLEKHFMYFSEDKKALSNHYYNLGRMLYFNKNLNDRGGNWVHYYFNAFKTDPFNVKLLVSIFISLFGQKVYFLFINLYKKINAINFKIV